jgi:toxin ParE1/3/4
MVKLIWSPRSLKDLEVIYEYIKTDSMDNARDFVNQLINTTIATADFPLAGRVVPEFKDIHLREKLYKNYRIIYKLDSGSLEVITVLHQAKRLIKEEF